MPDGVVIIVIAMVIGGVIKSIVDAIATRRELPPDTMSQDRFLRLEDEMDALRKVVAQLEEAEDFRKALNAPQEPASSMPPSTSEK